MKLYSAAWCTYCKPIKQLIEENNLRIEIVDIDHSPEAAISAGIKQVPTLELEDGELVPESAVITSWIKENFDV